MSELKPFEGWAVVELMGHRRVGAYVTEATLAGAGFLRLDVPGEKPGDALVATQFVAPTAVYALTPTTEEVARGLAARAFQAPVQRWELPAPKAKAETTEASWVSDGDGGAVSEDELELGDDEVVEEDDVPEGEQP